MTELTARTLYIMRVGALRLMTERGRIMRLTQAQDITGHISQMYVDAGLYPCRVLRYRGADMQEVARKESQDEAYRLVMPYDVILAVGDKITVGETVYSVERIIDAMTDRISIDAIVRRER